MMASLSTVFGQVLFGSAFFGALFTGVVCWVSLFSVTFFFSWHVSFFEYFDCKKDIYSPFFVHFSLEGNKRGSFAHRRRSHWVDNSDSSENPGAANVTVVLVRGILPKKAGSGQLHESCPRVLESGAFNRMHLSQVLETSPPSCVLHWKT